MNLKNILVTLGLVAAGGYVANKVTKGAVKGTLDEFLKRINHPTAKDKYLAGGAVLGTVGGNIAYKNKEKISDQYSKYFGQDKDKPAGQGA